MKYKTGVLLLMLLFSVGLGLSGCKSEIEGIDPKIVEQLQTPCEGKIVSVFKEDSSGWALNVSCVDEQKIQEQRDKMFEGLKRVEPRKDGVNPLDY